MNAVIPSSVAREACPCDDCAYRARCSRSGESCAAFDAYLNGGQRWRRCSRLPRRLADEQLADRLLGEAALALDE